MPRKKKGAKKEEKPKEAEQGAKPCS